jgi:hypothetical protein
VQEMSFFEQLAASLPAIDGEVGFKGDKLVAVSSNETLAYVEKLVPIDQATLDRLNINKRRILPAGAAEVDADWNTHRDGFSLRLRITLNFPNSADSRTTLAKLCEDWCSGDSASIVRYRNDKVIRLAIIERISDSCAKVKMYFGPPHTSWSASDETLYQLGVRTIEADVRGSPDIETLRKLAGHEITPRGELLIDYDQFRSSSRERKNVSSKRKSSPG